VKLHGLRELFIGEGKSRTLTDEEVTRIRRDGLGNGFSVIDPADGYRADGSLWFGDCSVCNERVTNSWTDGVWKHTNYTRKVINPDGFISSATSRQSDYCPKERGVLIDCEIVQR
jgi:hypothetical protein